MQSLVKPWNLTHGHEHLYCTGWKFETNTVQNASHMTTLRLALCTCCNHLQQQHVYREIGVHSDINPFRLALLVFSLLEIYELNFVLY